jgi:hypothetical protein
VAQQWLEPISHRADTCEAKVSIEGKAYTYYSVGSGDYANFLRLLTRNQGRALAFLKGAASGVEKCDEQKPV